MESTPKRPIPLDEFYQGELDCADFYTGVLFETLRDSHQIELSDGAKSSIRGMMFLVAATASITDIQLIAEGNYDTSPVSGLKVEHATEWLTKKLAAEAISQHSGI